MGTGIFKKRTGKGAVPTEGLIRRSAIVTVICDVVLILALVTCLFVYISANNVNTYNQNVDNITGIATAEAELLRTVLNNSGNELKSAYKYCHSRSAQEILEYLSVISGEEDEYQLLTRDEEASDELFHVYSGFSTRFKDGEYQSVEYRNTALASSLYNYSTQIGRAHV